MKKKVFEKIKIRKKTLVNVKKRQQQQKSVEK